MIRAAVLLSITAALAFLALSAGRGSHDAEALILPDECDGKIGVVDNEGFHPVLWGFIQAMDYTQQPVQQDGSRDFTLAPASGNAPIPVNGTLQANGTAAASGSGDYSGNQATVEAVGSIEFWGEGDVFPRRVILEYEVSGLPGGKPIIFRLDCFFDPPPDFADPDGDGVTSARHDTLSFGSASAGRMDSELLGMVYRDTQGQIVDLDIADPNDITTQDNKTGPFEPSTIRDYYEVEGVFGGSFAPNNSSLSGGLPPELGGGSFGSQLGGNFHGNFAIGSAFGVHSAGTPSQALYEFDFTFHAHATTPFTFAGGISSGDWSWSRDPDRPVVVTSMNLETGQTSLSVPVLLDASNLRGIYPDTQFTAAGANGALPGDPIRFTENVNIAFPPFAQLTSVLDNCPTVANADQLDTDADGLGDACEGIFWADGNCNAKLGTDDALATLMRQVDLEPEYMPASCDPFGTMIGDVTVGDWNCDGSQTPADALIPLLSEGGLSLGDYPALCPDPGQFVPNPPPA